NELITQLEKTQHHLNQEYGNELIIDDLGNVQHGCICVLSIIANKFTYAELQEKLCNELITQLEKTLCHLNREYGNELIIDDLGNVQHDNCIEHCLNFALVIAMNIILLVVKIVVK
ncbi:10286_t:CDS:2, partial [Entrophospora sp. SA101]